MRQSHLIISNAGVMWITRVLLLVPQMVLVPYLIGTIGEDGYGVYALVWALMVSIDLLELSLQEGVVKYSAAFLARSRLDQVNRVVSSSFVYSLAVGAVASAGIIAAASAYGDAPGGMGPALLVVGVMVFFIVPLTPYVAVIQSRQRYYVGALAETAAKYLSLLLVVVWFTAVRPSLQVLVIISAGVLFLSRLAQVPIAYRMVPGLRNRPRLFGWEQFKLIASFGAASVLLALCLAANTTGVRWLMGSLASPAFVAHLAIILMPGMLLSQVVLAMTITVMPATSACEAAGNREMLRELLVRGMRYTMILALAGILAAVFLLRDGLVLWVGEEYRFLAPYSLALFAGQAFLLSASCAHQMLKGLGKLRTAVLIYLSGLVILPFGLILGIHRAGGGPYLAVTAGLVAGQLCCGCLNAFFAVRVVGAGRGAVFSRVYLQPAAAAVTAGVLAFGAVAVIGLAGPAGRAAAALLGVGLFLTAGLRVISTAAERREAGELLRLAGGKVAAAFRRGR